MFAYKSNDFAKGERSFIQLSRKSQDARKNTPAIKRVSFAAPTRDTFGTEVLRVTPPDRAETLVGAHCCCSVSSEIRCTYEFL
jgi:hypothetical protein